MKHPGLIILFFILSLVAFQSSGQTKRQLSGRFSISEVSKTGTGIYRIIGDFLDPGNLYSASDIQIGDRIVDILGNSFEITTLTTSGSSITAITLSLENQNGSLGDGMIFRPTGKGFPLTVPDLSASLMSTLLNSAVITIDEKTAVFSSGSTLPESTSKIGDVLFITSNAKIYKLTASGWSVVAESDIPVSFDSDASSIPAGAKGDLVRNFFDNNVYVYDGNKWGLPAQASALPSTSKFGDIFYVTTEQKLYMSDVNSKWISISGSSTPGGTAADLPANNKVGDLFFNTEKNALMMYTAEGKWVEVSTNGSTPAGNVNPNPLIDAVKEGNLFYNNSDHRLYVYNGTSWVPVENTLRNGQILVGNAANIATSVILSGDATLTTAGKLTVKDLAITNEKLDKTNIPLSGFGLPLDHISMGDGVSNFKITNLANPSAAADATTKSYVDALITTPGTIALANNSLFVGSTANKAVAVLKSLVPISGFDKAYANVSMGTGTTGANFKIVNMADPTLAQDAATKNYVDTRLVNPSNLTLPTDNLLVGNVVGIATAVLKNTISLTGFGAPTADIAMAGFKLSNLANPVAAQDAATKNYIDTKIIDPSNINLTTGNLFIGGTTGKATDVLKSTIPLSGFAPAAADISAGGFLLTNMASPLADGDASTKKYVDDLFKTPSSLLSLPTGNFFMGNATGQAEAVQKKLVPLSGFAKAIDNIYMGDAATQFNISFLKDPMFDQDAATKIYVDSKLSTPGALTLPTANIFVGDATNKAMGVLKSDIPLSDFGTAKADLSIGDGTANFKLTNVADPAGDQDAATKKYVDAGILMAGAAGKDNLGNHTATQNIILSVNAISNDGTTGKGLNFETSGSAIFGQDLTVNGTFYTPSDRRLKTHIETLSAVLERINLVRGVRFEYTDQHKYASGPKIGVIAQELQKVYPEMVTQGKDGFLKVDYTQLTGILIQAVKEQQKEIEDLKSTMKHQQQQIDNILKKIQ